MDFIVINDEIENKLKELLFNETNQKYIIIKRRNGDILVKRVRDINIKCINDFQKYNLCSSVIQYCTLNNTKLFKLKYKKIVDEIYNIIGDANKIIKNTKLNIIKERCEIDGFYYLERLGISIKIVDSNTFIKEIYNQCKKNNINISMTILLKTNIKILLDL